MSNKVSLHIDFGERECRPDLLRNKVMIGATLWAQTFKEWKPPSVSLWNTKGKNTSIANMVDFPKGNTISRGENKFLLLVWLWPTRFKVVTLASLFKEHVILSSIQQMWNSSQINSPQIGLTYIPLRGWERGLYTANHSWWTYIFCRIPPLLLHLKLATGLPWWSSGWDSILPMQGPGFDPHSGNSLLFPDSRDSLLLNTCLKNPMERGAW